PAQGSQAGAAPKPAAPAGTGTAPAQGAVVEVKVPDIGDFKDVPVIEVLVKPGDAVKAEDSLVTLESDKATMDVPSPSAGTVKDLKVKPGDKVSEGSVILTLDSAAPAAASQPPPNNATAGQAAQPAAPQADAKASTQAAAPQGPSARASASAPATSAAPAGAPIEVKVPDIGDFKDVPVIEVLVKPGDAAKPGEARVPLGSE